MPAEPTPTVPALPISVQPIRHWKLALRRAWSIRFIAIFTVASGLNAVWPNLGGELSPLVYNVLGVILGALAFLSVFVQQRGFPKAKLPEAGQ
jgi:hypothetical protein